MLKFTRLAAALLLTLSLSARAQNQPELVTRTFDLSSITTSGSGEVTATLGLPLRSSIGAGSVEESNAQARGVQMEENHFGLDNIAELVRTAAVITDVDEDYLHIDVSGNSLVVRCLPSTMDNVTSVMAFLERTLTRTAVIEIALLAPETLRTAGAGLLSPAAVSALLKNNPEARRLRSIVTLGKHARLNASRLRQYVRDYDVEVAEKARLADPQMRPLFEGAEAGIQIEPTIDGRYVVRLKGRASKRVGKDRIIAQPASGVGSLVLPSAQSSCCAVSAIMTPGSGFVVGSHEAGRSPWLIRLVRVDEPAESGMLSVVPVGALNRPSFSPRIRSVIGPRASFDSGPEEVEDSDEPILPSDQLMHLIYKELESQDAENFRSSIFEVDQKIFMKISPNDLPRAVKKLERSAQPFLHNIATEFRYGLVPNESVGDLLQQDAAAVAATLDRSAQLLCRTGSSGLIASGKEWLSLKDKDAEIAQGSQISDPIIDALFAGVVIRSTASFTSTSSVALAIDFTFQADTGRGRLFDTGLKDVGKIDLDDLTHVTGKVRYVADAGQWRIVQAAPLTGTGTTFILTARASR